MSDYGDLIEVELFVADHLKTDTPIDELMIKRVVPGALRAEPDSPRALYLSACGQYDLSAKLKAMEVAFASALRELNGMQTSSEDLKNVINLDNWALAVKISDMMVGLHVLLNSEHVDYHKKLNAELRNGNRSFLIDLSQVA